MKKVNSFLLIVILTLTVVLASGVGFKAYDLYETDKRLAREEEQQMAQLLERSQEAQERVKELEEELQQMTEDKEELQRFIAQIQNEELAGYDTVSENAAFSENGMGSDNVGVSGNSAASGNGFIQEADYMTLAERRSLRTSIEETWAVNQADRKEIAESTIDFSGWKIACIGDSITAATNLNREENYQQYSYPARLKELLGANEVYNLGIGGSSIGRYWLEAFVDRYRDIPEDVDIIIVMGGTNDGFCASDKEFGSLSERASRTFCGDLDELMRGLREHYPDADIFFATPLPNVLHDYLMREKDYLLPQQKFVDVILTLANEYGYKVIDLYNSNILDSHDADIAADYVPDGVHANHEGYQIMAEHFAAELIRYYESR